MRQILLTLVFAIGCIQAGYGQSTDTLVTDSGLKYFITHKGTGPKIKSGWVVIQHFTLYLLNGKKIESTHDYGSHFSFQYPSTKIIKGCNEAFSLMRVGDRGIFIMPPELAYGDKADPDIPPNSTLVFDIEFVDMREKTLSMVVEEVLFDKPVTDESKPKIEEALEVVENLRVRNFDSLYVGIFDMTSLGRRLLKKYPTAALEIFRLNTSLFPTSPIVFDALGDGYRAIGEADNAIINYEKCLVLKPDSPDTLKKLNKLKTK